MNNKQILTASLALSLALTANLTHAKHRGGSIDNNGDGSIELSEAIAAASAKAERKFTRLDTDEDGLVSFEEFSASKSGSRDLTLYAQEIVDCVADLKAELGSDTIVVPSVDDFSTPQERFDSKDSNSDTFIDLDEATAAANAKATERFTAMDADADGFVTKEERKAFRSERAGTKRALKTCISEVVEDSEVI
ncbi:hypothetical protein DXX93_03700 [Thalassotalea euphylliae]|uniref:EF-hand domain-containing protein n=1 Tax=Thalassotalea euphylliae TaxID=1655234 RepID=A0A3E0TMJ1_9GAMM|nr:hypothetical protein [Thalassotalea euphylliae]REL25746.1 hypothetical protein DXX93_03700 [Thalassotalea euphylliae]